MYSFINNVGLPDEGPCYTWQKKKNGPNNITERLDKGAASIEYLNLFLAVKLHHHIFSSSDHCPISLELKVPSCLKAPSFKFDKLWSSRKNFDVLLKRTWYTRFEWSNMFCLTIKCKLLKEKAKNWAITRFGNIFRQLREVEGKNQN